MCNYMEPQYASVHDRCLAEHCFSSCLLTLHLVYCCLACSHDAVLLCRLHQIGGFLQRRACSLHACSLLFALMDIQ